MEAGGQPACVVAESMWDAWHAELADTTQLCLPYPAVLREGRRGSGVRAGAGSFGTLSAGSAQELPEMFGCVTAGSDVYGRSQGERCKERAGAIG